LNFRPWIQPLPWQKFSDPTISMITSDKSTSRVKVQSFERRSNRVISPRWSSGDRPEWVKPR
jgi:hypothetical protein